MITGTRSMTYLTGQAEGGTVSAVTSGCAAPWPCAAGRTCLGSVLGAPEISPLLADWSKKKTSFIMKDMDISITDSVFYKTQIRNNIVVHITSSNAE